MFGAKLRCVTCGMYTPDQCLCIKRKVADELKAKLATAEAQAADVGGIKTWQERANDDTSFKGPMFDRDKANYMQAEIAELRAALASRPVPQASEQDKRAAFEAWYAPLFAGGEVANMPRRSNGEYVRPQAQIAWMAYQAALAAKSEQPQAGASELPRLIPSWARDMHGETEVITIEEACAHGQACYAIGRAAGTDDGKFDSVSLGIALLAWNRAQKPAPIEIGKEYFVADAIAAIASQGTEQGGAK